MKSRKVLAEVLEGHYTTGNVLSCAASIKQVLALLTSPPTGSKGITFMKIRDQEVPKEKSLRTSDL